MLVGDYMKAFVTSAEDENFFTAKYLKEFVSATLWNKTHSVPGYNYFSKIDCFMDGHVSMDTFLSLSSTTRNFLIFIILKLVKHH